MERHIRGHRRLIAILIIVSIVMLLSFCTICIIRYYETAPIRRGEFTSELWDKYPKYRYKMIDDMEKKVDIWNLSQEEIVNVLGTNGVDFGSITTIRYYIRDSFLFFPEYYYIDFSGDGRVVDVFRDYD